MKQILTRIGILSGVFVFGIILFSHIMNIENMDQTEIIKMPTLPVVYINDEEQLKNEMFGYVSDMEESYMRDTLTILPEDYSLDIAIATFDNPIQEISYEVRSLDGTRLVEESTVNYLTQAGGYLKATLPIKKLLEKKEEYLLKIILHLEGREAAYYTRIIDGEGMDFNQEMFFCMNFSNNSITNADMTDIASYLEPNSQGDNSSFAYADIHSNYRMVTMQGLNLEVQKEPIPCITEMRNNVLSMRLSYIVKETDTEEQSMYAVNEFYRVREGEDRLYLLDFERHMEEIFQGTDSAFSSKSINLGIIDGDVEYQSSQDGKVTAFVNHGMIWSYNNANGVLTQVYGYKSEALDSRLLRNAYDVRIADVDEMGSMDFVISGYIDHGDHEGMVGILVYHYDAMTNTIEEKAFIPYLKDYSYMKFKMGRLAYVNRSQELYCMLDGTVYKIQLNGGQVEVLAQDLSEECYVVSEDRQLFAWQEEQKVYDSKTIHAINLETGSDYTISCGETERIRLIGYMNRDLIYGIADADMIQKDRTGYMWFPMKELFIADEQGRVQRNYRQDGVFIQEVTVLDQMLSLTRVVKNGESYTQINDDQIISGEEIAEGAAYLEQYVTDTRKKEYRIRFHTPMEEQTVQMRVPKEVIFEVSRDLKLNTQSVEDTGYYVYAKGTIYGIYEKAGEAIETAERMHGIVTDSTMKYVWEKGNRVSEIDIKSIVPTAILEGESSISQCLKWMLNDAGVYEDLDIELSNDSVIDILQRYIGGRVVDLTGCSLDCALYFVNKGIPVFAMKNAEQAVLIAGYDKFGNTILADPVTGTKSKMGPNDSKNMFEQAGNIFITYLP